MIVWNAKDPNEVVAYPVDWSGDLGRDTITAHDFTLMTGDAVISKLAYGLQSLVAYIGGGTDETTSTFLYRITTEAGQTLERNFSLYVAANANSFRPATTIKRTLLEQAFTECALNGWEYDITPEEKNTALTRLDMLMAELRGRGVDLGYNMPNTIGQGDMDDESGIPDAAVFGVATLLALRLCPTMGKTMSKESREAQTQAMKALRSASIIALPTMRFRNGTPSGSGNKPWGTRYPYSITG